LLPEPVRQVALPQVAWHLTHNNTYPMCNISEAFCGEGGCPKHFCLLRQDGEAICAGTNIFGQLGRGAMTEFENAFAPVAGAHSFKSLTSGAMHVCGLDDDGTVHCWGLNTTGQLGDGSIENRATPVAVAGLSKVVEVAAGSFHTCALQEDLRVFCWGLNLHNELGTLGGEDPHPGHSAEPIEVVF
jgi:alpha-tubulin suppressor-like RCC1 family protein